MSLYRKCEFALLKLSAGFSPLELAYLQNIFELADEDRSGQLNFTELIELLEICLRADVLEKDTEINKIGKLFVRMDNDKSMSLDCSEFVRLIT